MTRNWGLLNYHQFLHRICDFSWRHYHAQFKILLLFHFNSKSWQQAKKKTTEFESTGNCSPFLRQDETDYSGWSNRNSRGGVPLTFWISRGEWWRTFPSSLLYSRRLISLKAADEILSRLAGDRGIAPVRIAACVRCARSVNQNRQKAILSAILRGQWPFVVKFAMRSYPRWKWRKISKVRSIQNL